MADTLHFLSQTERDVEVAHVIAEGFDDLGIYEFEHAWTKIDQRNLDSQGCGHASILDTHNTGGEAGRHASRHG